jgi:molecular chaperone Hsp33
MTEPDPNASIAEVRTYFVRGRNALLARADFSSIYIDYYLHLADQKLRYASEHDEMLKDALAALTLHLASKPQDEVCAWTMNFHRPHLNLFVTGRSRPGEVTGRVFTEDVRDFGKNILISQITRPAQPPFQSLVEFSEADVFRSIEEYYEQSEQRIGRLFRHDEEDIVLITAQPDCDEDWLRNLTREDVLVIDQKEKLSLLEQRQYTFHCGCSVERLYPVLAALSERDRRDAFGDEEIITVTCPRCAARYRAAKEHFEAWQESA